MESKLSNNEVSVSSTFAAMTITDDTTADVRDDTRTPERRSEENRTTGQAILYSIKAVPKDGIPKTFYRDVPWPGVDYRLENPVPEPDHDAVAIVVKAVIETSDFRDVEEHDITSWRQQNNFHPQTRIKVDELDSTEIRIHSSHLRNVLESVVDYDPVRSPDLTHHEADEQGCYQTLLLNYDSLYDAYQSHLHAFPEHRQEAECVDMGSNRMSTFWEEFLKSEVPHHTWEARTTNEVAALLQLIQRHYRYKLTPIIRKLAGPQSRVEFESLWLLYKPGTVVYRIVGEEINALVIESAKRLVVETTMGYGDFTPKISYEVAAWRYDWDGRKVVRLSTLVNIPFFQGEIPCNSLPLVPLKIYEQAHGKQDREMLRQRGAKFMTLLNSTHRYRSYNHSESTYKGEVVIDPQEYETRAQMFNEGPRNNSYRQGLADRIFDGPQDDDFSGRDIKFADGDTNVMAVPKWVPFDNNGHRRFSEHLEIDPGSPEQLSWLASHATILLPSRVGGLALGIKKWKRFNVESLEDIKLKGPSKLLDDVLVLDSQDKAVLNRMVRDTIRDRNVQADFIPGKGQGQIVCLYGPSGTGKTLTAELVAQDAGRPLISLLKHDFAAQNFQTEAEENRLREWFQLAARWGAILLLDEADILLEKRTSGGAQNHLVTVLLRTMEYYAGILFLTTNRYGQIDDSFISRITTAIHYPQLNQAARNLIWEKFFSTLGEPHTHGIRISDMARRNLLEDTSVLNGREIRNIFQSAIMHANVESQKKGELEDASCQENLYLKWTHFEGPLERHKKFKAAIDEAYGADEIARNRRLRNY